MPITPAGQGRFTGLLGYDRQYEYLGEAGLPYRLVEKYSYTVTDYSLSNRSDLPSFFKNQFASLLGVFSGDINITSLDLLSSKEHTESQVSFQKHKITFEVRSAGNFVDQSRDGYENSKNEGISAIVPYADMITNFKDSFSFDMSEGADRRYVHDISFNLITGQGNNDFSSLKNIAQQIAGTLFSGEPSSLSNSAFSYYGDFTDSSVKQYFSEKYDAYNFGFSFTKTRELNPFNSGSYSHSLSHSINYSENGIFNIQESLSVLGKKEYSQAVAGYNLLSQGSLDRCLGIYSKYSDMVSSLNPSITAFGNLLTNTSISETHNIPALTVDASFSYTNDPSENGNLSKKDTMTVSRVENGTISISHDIAYNLNTYLTGNTDTYPVSGSNNVIQVMQQDRESSLVKAQGVYGSLTNLNTMSSGIVRLKSDFSAPLRDKGYTAKFSYSDDPSYDITRYVDPYDNSRVTGFKKLSINCQKTEPTDIINEYKIINRPTQNSVLSYGYQQEPGTFSVNFDGKLERQGNLLSAPAVPSGDIHRLLNYAGGVFLAHSLMNSDIYNYFLRDVKYGLNSDNSFDMSIQYTFTKKLHGNNS